MRNRLANVSIPSFSMLYADHHTFKVLDFEKIVSLLSRFCVTEFGRLFALTLKPLKDLPVIKERLGEVTEMKLLLRTRGPLPLHELKLVTPLVNKAKPEGSFLNPKDLLTLLILLRGAATVKQIIASAQQLYPLLGKIGARIKVLEPLETELSTGIDSQGVIFDSASSELQRIRGEIRKLRDRVRYMLERVISEKERAFTMQDHIITIRNDRYVIPVKAVFKTRVPGVVHDQSSNLSTYFIEPFEVVALNNDLILLTKSEEEETVRILRRLTDFVRENDHAIRANEKLLAILDAVQAKAHFSEGTGGREPELSDQSEIHLLKARHPLLLLRPTFFEEEGTLPVFDNQGVVPIDIVFPAQCSAMVITGTNMGGKTAALKTIGLLTLMVQTGMHIPVAEGSRVTVWDKIFADIGDEQNLEESVSTFSSHVTHVSAIINQANESSLVLLDEVGAGTDPQEGSALALAFIDTLRYRKAKVAVTGHHTLLKAYATFQADVLNVSVSFDTENLRPTFTLLYGVPGNSNALETAARLGLNPAILARAKQHLHEHDRRILALINGLEKTVGQYSLVKSTIDTLLASARRYEKRISQLAEQMERRQEAIIGETETRARHLFREAESQIKKLLHSKSLDEEKNFTGLQKNLKTVKANFKAGLGIPKKPPKVLGPLAKGDSLIIGKEKKRGRVVHVNYASQQVEIQLEGVRLKAGINALAKLHGVTKRHDEQALAEQSKIHPIVLGERPESCAPLNLMGFTVDEAIAVIDKAIDNALVIGIQEIRIIHGFGTGRLRQGIHDHLKQQPLIKRFYPGKPFEGGAGVTIAEIQS